MTTPITGREFGETPGTEDWRVIGDGACAYFAVDSLTAAIRFVQAIGAIPGIDAYPPDIDIRPDGVTVRLITNADGYFGMSQHHVEQARQVSAAARQLGLAATPAAVQSILVVPGAGAASDVMPFWQAALGYDRRSDSPDEDLVDPRSRGPAFWFEAMEEPRADRGGGDIHIAAWVPYEVAEARVAAALAAGGRLVRDQFAPAWWTLADSAGNEIDIATIKYRD